MQIDEIVEWSGVAAVVVTIGSILVATGISPAFAWRANALSDLGVTTTEAGTVATAAVFNSGLILGGLLGLLFAGVLFGQGQHLWDRAVAGLFGLTLALLALVGVFPLGTRLHLPVAVGFYLLLSLTLWADAVVATRTEDRRWVTISGVAGTVNALGWVVWGVVPELLQRGVALPEFVGALTLGAWVCARSLALVRGTRAST